MRLARSQERNDTYFWPMARLAHWACDIVAMFGNADLSSRHHGVIRQFVYQQQVGNQSPALRRIALRVTLRIPDGFPDHQAAQDLGD